MTKTTLNSITTFIPLMIIPFIGIFLVFCPFGDTKKDWYNFTIKCLSNAGACYNFS